MISSPVILLSKKLKKPLIPDNLIKMIYQLTAEELEQLSLHRVEYTCGIRTSRKLVLWLSSFAGVKLLCVHRAQGTSRGKSKDPQPHVVSLRVPPGSGLTKEQIKENHMAWLMKVIQPDSKKMYVAG